MTDSKVVTSLDNDSAAPKMAAATNNKTNRLVWILMALIAMAAAAGGFYLFSQDAANGRHIGKTMADVSGAIQRVDQQTEAVREVQREIDKQAALVQSTAQQNTARLEAMEQQLLSQNQRIIALSTTNRDDWLLAEAEYLMRLANQRLMTAKDYKAAIELLTAADTIAAELDDQGLYPLRKTLAEEIAALRNASGADIDGLYFRLGAVAKQVEQLRLLPATDYQLPFADSTSEKTAPATWQQRLKASLSSAFEKMGNAITIQRRDDMYKPLLAPEYESAVRQNVHLMFEQAQMAAMAGKQRLYDDSLNKAKHWLNNYYVLDKDGTAKMVQEIDQLLTVTVETQTPDISSSLRALKLYINTIHSIDGDADTAEGDEQ